MTFIAYCIIAIVLHVVRLGWLLWWSIPIAKRIAVSRQDYLSDSDLNEYIFAGLKQVHGFASTLHWWNGTWVGLVPFWRPLTSYGFWLEYKEFPPNRFDEWFAVSCVSNLIFCALLIVFTKKLSGSTIIAFLTGLFFGGDFLLSPLAIDAHLFSLFGSETFSVPCDLSFSVWKNQPDIWSDSAIIAGLICALDKKWIWMIVCSFVAVAFKENGWLIFPLALLVIWGKDRLKSTPRNVYIAIVLSIGVLALVRFNCGMAVFRGYHMGENNLGSGHGAVYRYILSSMLPYPAMFLQFLAPALFGTFAFFGLAASRLHRAFRLALVCLGLAVATAVDAIAGKADPMVALYMQCDWDLNLKHAITVFLWLSLAYYVFRVTSERRLLISLVGMVLLSSALIVLSTQVQSHVLYIAYAFRSVLGALVVTELCFKILVPRLEALADLLYSRYLAGNGRYLQNSDNRQTP